MEMSSKPCKDRFLHPILVQKNTSSKMGHKRNYLKNNIVTLKNIYVRQKKVRAKIVI
jgi:hypothetical protein